MTPYCVRERISPSSFKAYNRFIFQKILSRIFFALILLIFYPSSYFYFYLDQYLLHPLRITHEIKAKASQNPFVSWNRAFTALFSPILFKTPTFYLIHETHSQNIDAQFHVVSPKSPVYIRDNPTFNNLPNTYIGTTYRVE